MGVISTVLIVVQAVLLTDVVVSVFTQGQTLSEVSGAVAILAGVVCARAVVSYAGERLAFRSSAKAKSELRVAVYDRAIELGPVWLSARNSAELTQLTTRGIDGLDAYFARYLPQLILAVIVPIGVGIVILTQDVLAAVIVVLTLPLIPVFMVLIGMYTQRKVDRQWRVLARLGGHFADIVAGMPTLKAFGRAQSQAAAVRSIGDQYRVSTMGVLRISFLSALVLELLAMLSVAMVAVSIGLRLVEGEMTLTAGLLVLILVPEVYLPLRLVGMHYHASAEGLGAAQQMIEVLEQTPLSQQGTREDVPDLRHAQISFANVDFTYPSRDQSVLQHFDCTIEPRSLTVLTGQSGSGKSTVLGLLERFIDPAAGTVAVSAESADISISDFTYDSWRQHVGWLGQSADLVPGSIADNVRLGSPTCSTERVWAALADVDLADFVAGLPDGLDTTLGEGARGLSLGQQRRLALARVICQRPQLALLDEPLAALDRQSRDTVRQAIGRLAEQCTVVVTSHHTEVIDGADQVIDMSVVSV